MFMQGAQLNNHFYNCRFLVVGAYKLGCKCKATLALLIQNIELLFSISVEEPFGQALHQPEKTRKRLITNKITFLIDKIKMCLPFT